MSRVVVPGTLDSLGALRRYAEEASVSAGLDQDRMYGLCLAIDEIATNTIVHGYNRNAIKGDISIRAEISDTELLVVLEDSAPEFDPRLLAPPAPDALNSPLEERTAGGLGIYLALQNIDRFEYRRDGIFNRNSFYMNRPEKKGALQ